MLTCKKIWGRVALTQVIKLKEHTEAYEDLLKNIHKNQLATLLLLPLNFKRVAVDHAYDGRVWKALIGPSRFWSVLSGSKT